jgi:hypothetical protein
MSNELTPRETSEFMTAVQDYISEVEFSNLQTYLSKRPLDRNARLDLQKSLATYARSLHERSIIVKQNIQRADFPPQKEAFQSALSAIQSLYEITAKVLRTMIA